MWWAKSTLAAITAAIALGILSQGETVGANPVGEGANGQRIEIPAGVTKRVAPGRSVTAAVVHIIFEGKPWLALDCSMTADDRTWATGGGVINPAEGEFRPDCGSWVINEAPPSEMVSDLIVPGAYTPAPANVPSPISTVPTSAVNVGSRQQTPVQTGSPECPAIPFVGGWESAPTGQDGKFRTYAGLAGNWRIVEAYQVIGSSGVSVQNGLMIVLAPGVDYGQFTVIDGTVVGFDSEDEARMGFRYRLSQVYSRKVAISVIDAPDSWRSAMPDPGCGFRWSDHGANPLWK